MLKIFMKGSLETIFKKYVVTLQVKIFFSNEIATKF